ncbi:hypothetical protein HPB50_022472 [Hyalomma asiaticum]|uniref:Uncharacterized protein n=1 Tax=Hyalomma asiaticum TaxID=266040 RepID=A0ACB7RYE0_HYAAI|nr:hypothetical protein HPB50_022472 [Hyalomma asiaticum]
MKTAPSSASPSRRRRATEDTRLDHRRDRYKCGWPKGRPRVWEKTDAPWAFGRGALQAATSVLCAATHLAALNGGRPLSGPVATGRAVCYEYRVPCASTNPCPGRSVCPNQKNPSPARLDDDGLMRLCALGRDTSECLLFPSDNGKAARFREVTAVVEASCGPWCSVLVVRSRPRVLRSLAWFHSRPSSPAALGDRAASWPGSTMVGRNRVHLYTFLGRLPAGTTNVDVCVALVKTFKRTDLLCVQDFGAGRFEVTFKNKESVDRFLAHPVIEMQGTECKFEYSGVQTKVVRVLSGIRRVRIEMARPVPNLLRVEDKVVMCEYDGVVRLCRRCSLPGHHAAECETPKLRRAHVAGGDHGVFSCRVRTFASVATRTPTRGESSGVPAKSEENFPTIERPPQLKGPAPGDQVSEKGGEKGESGLADAASSPAAAGQ